jgi:capsular polysaccharide biosynthesis protein
VTVTARPDSFEVADYLGVLRRRWWIVVGLAVLGAVATAGYIVVAPKTYTATATVYVNANAANANQVLGTRTTTVVNMDNEAQIVQSNSVAQLAAHDLHSRRTPTELTQQISVAVPANTQVLQISCAARSPGNSAACAQAFAKAYLASRQVTSQSKIKSQTQELQARMEPLQLKAIALRSEIKSLISGSQKLAAKQAELADTSAQLDALRSDVAILGASINYNPGYIITAAAPQATPTSPKPLLFLPSGLMAGLLIGLVIAFTVDRRDERIHAAKDVERFLELPVLFRLPQKKLGPQRTLISPRSRAGRAFIELSQAAATALGQGDHVIFVVGTSASQAPGVVAANLAAALARTRADVILVCADLTDTSTPQLLGSGGGRGLAELLAGRATVFEVARRAAEVPRLRVVAPGMDAAAAVNYMRHDTCSRLIAELHGDARYVVIETDATGDGSDTFSLAEFADAALVVIEIGSSTRSEVADTVRRLDMMRTPVLGAVVLPRAAARKGPREQPPRQMASGQAPPLRRIPPEARPMPRDPSPLNTQAPRQPRPVTEPRRRVLPGQDEREGIARPPARASETLPLPRVTTSTATDKDTDKDSVRPDPADFEAGEG